ncbi:Hypp6108 [Branchiostoma lanceolatum]|uniref:Hypp6108 protein n=1 Tax=Branchiostoma lanceolatum TaxID=7740 RepID=A0A8J9W8V8_BRALA|nr:Hypp6108 [Branchiostoma lanceolatum]
MRDEEPLFSCVRTLIWIGQKFKEKGWKEVLQQGEVWAREMPNVLKDTLINYGILHWYTSKKGKGLWCSKKPPKTEDRDDECTHHQRKHVALAKEHLFGKEAGTSRKNALLISMDDKAYLRPGTSEGFTGTSAVLQPTDEDHARTLPLHDFPEPSVYVTPSAFRLIRKKPAGVDGDESLISELDSSIAVVHPEAYVGTNGTTWCSNLMRLRRECPDDFEVEPAADNTRYSRPVWKLCSWAKDRLYHEG